MTWHVQQHAVHKQVFHAEIPHGQVILPEKSATHRRQSPRRCPSCVPKQTGMIHVRLEHGGYADDIKIHCASRGKQAETNSLTHLEHGGYVHGRKNRYVRAQHDARSVSRSHLRQNSSLNRHEHGENSQNCHEHLRQHTDTRHRNTEKSSSSSFSFASSSSSSSSWGQKEVWRRR